MSVCVLVVDDNDMARELLIEVLQAGGYTTAEAADGRQALDYLHDHADRPHLILLDLMMPVMDGWEFLPAAQGARPGRGPRGAVHGRGRHRHPRGLGASAPPTPSTSRRSPDDVLAAVGRYC